MLPPMLLVLLVLLLLLWLDAEAVAKRCLGGGSMGVAGALLGAEPGPAVVTLEEGIDTMRPGRGAASM